LADQALLKIVCLLMRWLFSLTVLVVRGDRAKDAELLVLRHENAVLRRIRSSLVSSGSHGIRALDAIHTALAGQPWLPVPVTA
jgi:hypothetical protein